MRPHILAPTTDSVLAALAAGDTLLAFDFDGTLAPLVPRPHDARMRTTTRRLLAEVARAYPCVVLSGRRQEDVLARLEAVSIWGAVGNHGLEPSEAIEEWTARTRTWLAPLREGIRGLKGVALEDKGPSLAIHYRASPEPELAEAALRRLAELLEGVRLIGGHRVINLVPQGSPNKGTALLRLLEKYGCPTALYVGDDETDEDVFALSGPGLVTVRVGDSPVTRASYALSTQDEIDDLLQRLLLLRARSTPRRRWA
jgi:trehalose 6-phosphate phosphatase